MNGQPEIDADNKKKYKNLKRKLKFLVYEQECFQEELRRAQRKLLKVSRDKSFLLDRLLQYEHVDDDSSAKATPKPTMVICEHFFHWSLPNDIDFFQRSLNCAVQHSCFASLHMFYTMGFNCNRN
ncbi:UNVERIFIED_CONTAM: hypothetical protein FKN15_034290 [Acipenser sinensis]